MRSLRKSCRVNNFPSVEGTQRSRFYPGRNYDALIKNYHPPTTKEALTYLLLSFSLSFSLSLIPPPFFLGSFLFIPSWEVSHQRLNKLWSCGQPSRNLADELKVPRLRGHEFSPKGVACTQQTGDEHPEVSSYKILQTLQYHHIVYFWLEL